MGWISFKNTGNGIYRFEENELVIEYDNSGLLKVFKSSQIVYTKQFTSVAKVLLSVEPIYNKYKG